MATNEKFINFLFRINILTNNENDNFKNKQKAWEIL